jgi:hypothetical protein
MKSKRLILIAVSALITFSVKTQLSFSDKVQNIISSNSWAVRLVDIDGDKDLDAYFDKKIWLNDGKVDVFVVNDKLDGSSMPLIDVGRWGALLDSYGVGGGHKLCLAENLRANNKVRGML